MRKKGGGLFWDSLFHIGLFGLAKKMEKDVEKAELEYKAELNRIETKQAELAQELDHYIQREEHRQELLGLEEVKGMTSLSVERLLKINQSKLSVIYNDIAIKSGFREQVFDDSYMFNDLWLYTFAEQFEKSGLDVIEVAAWIDTLLQTFRLNVGIEGMDHLELLKNNSSYRDYMNHMFAAKDVDSCFFWQLFLSMGNSDPDVLSKILSERVEEMMSFVKEYIKFIIQLEYYLSQIVPHGEFGGRMEKLVVDKLANISEALGREIVPDRDLVNYVNPLYEDEIYPM